MPYWPMVAPTIRMTQRSDAVLEAAGVTSDAVVAIRVREVGDDLAGEKWRFWLSNMLSWFPLVGIAAERGLNALFGDPTNSEAALVMTADGGRYLLQLGGWGRSRPVALMHTFSHGAPLMPDKQLEASFFCQVMVDGRRYIVNSIDFKYLVKMIFRGEVYAPEMKNGLGDYWRASKWVVQEDPDQVVEALSGTYGPHRKQ